jgi:cyclic di-GMP phosphodiesterase Gmr
MRALGARIAMDDFGAGESSLGQLGRLTVEVIKIDRSFLRQIERQHHGGTLITGVVELAHAMGAVTIVEGVETGEEAAVVGTSGSDFAQGYLFSRPMRPPEIEALLRDRTALGRQQLERLGVA